ncbi:MAG: acylase [Armatimonadetes bacterium CG17_big_fil_post_rev_8_21_14_2_50_66_6]|nr:MAG: acylase [Armatimonadetes bacterium CG17_big_fil_post_rev_8_21_14_2_50_66_6]
MRLRFLLLDAHNFLTKLEVTMQNSPCGCLRGVTRLVRLLLLLTSWAIVQAAPSKSLMVPMRDGVKLSTDVYLPTGEGPWAVVLVRSPYNKSQPAAAAIAKPVLEAGYAFVAQDWRGRFKSEGSDFLVFSHDGWGEHQDGYDTVEWIAQQPWCNGKVATIGGSAHGIAQNLMAPTNPPPLVCQYVEVAFSDMYRQSAFQGGAWRKALVEGWLAGNAFDPNTIRAFHEHPDYDDFWRQFSPESRAAEINAPCLQVGGWYDIFGQGTIDQYLAVNTRGGPNARGKCKLVMEPYGHGANDILKFPNPGRPAAASQTHWLDLWLKEGGKGVDDIPNVHYYMLGDPEDPDAPGCEWRTADDWPIPADVRPFYLREDGRLDWEPPKAERQSLSYKYDPSNPVPTLGGANLILAKGPMDQRQVESRPEVLVFTSDVLKEPLEVTGRILAKLWVSSTAVDTDFTAKLCDVYPDGRSMLLLDGILRARHRNTCEKSELLEPGTVYELTLDLWSTSIAFNRGHRVRMSVSSSNAPRFEPNPNTGKPANADGEAVVATNTVYLDATHPSHLLLPVPKP